MPGHLDNFVDFIFLHLCYQVRKCSEFVAEHEAENVDFI